MTAALYNSLPSLGQAEQRFLNQVDREDVFASILNILEPYGSKFGLCLVHAHCTLADGEIMLAKGNVTTPVIPENGVPTYPSSWLANGKAYEFSTEPTETPPEDVLSKLEALTRGVPGLFGLSYIGKPRPNIQVEWTEGRSNMVKDVADYVQLKASADLVETEWQLEWPKKPSPTLVCMKICDTRQTRGKIDHKRTQTHVRVAC